MGTFCHTCHKCAKKEKDEDSYITNDLNTSPKTNVLINEKNENLNSLNLNSKLLIQKQEIKKEEQEQKQKVLKFPKKSKNNLTDLTKSERNLNKKVKYLISRRSKITFEEDDDDEDEEEIAINNKKKSETQKKKNFLVLRN